ncbi:MAG: hypothetical protein R6U50_01045 [Desulfobacterales bacterium]
MSKYTEIDLTKVRTYPALERKSKVDTAREAQPLYPGMTVKAFLEALPGILKADDFKSVVRAVADARRLEKPVIVMLGGHVIKTGCSPVLVDLAKRGLVTHVASNGSAAIHDSELALFGRTSEDVDVQLETGDFGMASDLADFINNGVKTGAERREGFGEAIGRKIVESGAPYASRALIAACWELNIPYTIHVGVGTDIVHQHPSADGAAIGEASLRDFRIMAAAVSRLGGGGVVLNLGSAVILPEVFLKCLAVARNTGHDVRNFTTANFDMLQHYRPGENVVRRPVLPGGRGYAITGHHEIMIPLLAAAILEYL